APVVPRPGRCPPPWTDSISAECRRYSVPVGFTKSSMTTSAFWRVALFACSGDFVARDKPLQSCRMRPRLRPFVDRKVHHDQSGCRQVVVKLFADLNIPRIDQLQRKFVQARIMTDNNKAALCAWLSDDCEQLLQTGVIDAVVELHARLLVKRVSDQCPSV